MDTNAITVAQPANSQSAPLKNIIDFITTLQRTVRTFFEPPGGAKGALPAFDTAARPEPGSYASDHIDLIA